MLKLDSVTVRYETADRVTIATDRVSFSVAQGERFVLLGPSGCGKSSILRAVAGFVRPAEGLITLNGLQVEDSGPDRIMVFQEFDQLLPWKTVAQNIVFAMRATGRYSRDEARARAVTAITNVRLAGFADAYPHTLSGGMKQRVAIARAMALLPDILLMDEPFAALDALTRSTMQEELSRLCEATGVTVLFVTHSIEEALVLGDRIAIMSAHPGTIRAEFKGLARECRSGPAFVELSEQIRRMVTGTPAQ
jgi:NitT/TauT family transport system ATP-binding protein